MEGVNDCCRIRQAAVFWQRWSLRILRVETLYRSELAWSRRDCTKATAMEVAMSVLRKDLIWRKARRCKIFVQNRVFRVGQLNGVIQISVRPTPVGLITDCCFLDTKSAITQTVYDCEISPRFLHQIGGSLGRLI